MELIIWDFLGTMYNANLGTLYPGTKELLLKSSKKYRHILSSSGFNKTKRLALIKNLGLNNFFVQIYVGLKTKKQFLNYCNKYNCKPKDVFVIGDTPLDIIAARPHHVRTVAVATGFHDIESIQREKPDKLFESFEDVKSVLAYFKER